MPGFRYERIIMKIEKIDWFVAIPMGFLGLLLFAFVIIIYTATTCKDEERIRIYSRVEDCIVYQVEHICSNRPIYTTICPGKTKTEWDELHGKIIERQSNEMIRK